MLFSKLPIAALISVGLAGLSAASVLDASARDLAGFDFALEKRQNNGGKGKNGNKNDNNNNINNNNNNNNNNNANNNANSVSSVSSVSSASSASSTTAATSSGSNNNAQNLTNAAFCDGQTPTDGQQIKTGSCN